MQRTSQPKFLLGLCNDLEITLGDAGLLVIKNEAIIHYQTVEIQNCCHLYREILSIRRIKKTGPFKFKSGITYIYIVAMTSLNTMCIKKGNTYYS